MDGGGGGGLSVLRNWKIVRVELMLCPGEVGMLDIMTTVPELDLEIRGKTRKQKNIILFLAGALAPVLAQA